MIYIWLILLNFSSFDCIGALTVEDAVGFLVGLSSEVGNELTFDLKSASVPVNGTTVTYAEMQPLVGMICDNWQQGGYYHQRISLNIEQMNAICNFLADVASKFLRGIGQKLDKAGGRSFRITSQAVPIDSWDVMFGHVKTIIPRACRKAQDGFRRVKNHLILFFCQFLEENTNVLLEEVGRAIEDPKDANVLAKVLTRRFQKKDGSILMYDQYKVTIADICENRLFRNDVQANTADDNRLINRACWELFQSTFLSLVEIGTMVDVDGESEDAIYKSVTLHDSKAPITMKQARPFVVNICKKVVKEEAHQLFLVHQDEIVNAVNYKYATKACDYILMLHMELLGKK